MRALVRKDLREHTLPLLYYMAVTAAFPWVLVVIDRGRPSSALLSTSFVMVVISPIMITHWLLNTEKTKRTLFLLRTLPVSAHHIVGAKQVVALIMLISIGVTSVTSSLTVLHILGGLEANAPNPVVMACVFIGVVLFTQSMLLSFLRFDQRLAIQVPYGGLLLLVLAYSALRNYRPNLFAAFIAMAGRWDVIVAGYLTACLIILCLHLIMVRLFERTDWSRPTAE